MLLIAYSVALMSTKCVKSIILYQHMCNELCREPQI